MIKGMEKGISLKMLLAQVGKTTKKPITIYFDNQSFKGQISQSSYPTRFPNSFLVINDRFILGDKIIWYLVFDDKIMGNQFATNWVLVEEIGIRAYNVREDETFVAYGVFHSSF